MLLSLRTARRLVDGYTRIAFALLDVLLRSCRGRVGESDDAPLLHLLPLPRTGDKKGRR